MAEKIAWYEGKLNPGIKQIWVTYHPSPFGFLLSLPRDWTDRDNQEYLDYEMIHIFLH